MFARVPTVRVSQATRSPVILQGFRKSFATKPASAKLNTKWNVNTNVIQNHLTLQTISLKYYSTQNTTTQQIQQASSNPTSAPFDPASVQPKGASTLKEVIQEQPALLTETTPKISSEPNLEALIQNLEKNITPIADSATASAAGGYGFFSPVGWAMDFVNTIHQVTGLPWWLTIAASTLTLRALLLPVMIEQTKHIARVNRIAPVIADLQKKAQTAAAAGKHMVARQYQMELMSTYRKNNANPLKNIGWAMLQIPPTICLFFAMREMAMTFESFHTGGISFFTDLAVSDPYKRLNILSAATFVVGFELNAKDMPTTWLKNAMRIGFSVMAVGIVLWTQYFPQCVHLYWLVNSVTTILLQYALRRNKTIRNFFGIPELLPNAPIPGLEQFAKKQAEPPKQLFLSNKPKSTPGTSPMTRKKEAPQAETTAAAPEEEKK